MRVNAVGVELHVRTSIFLLFAMLTACHVPYLALKEEVEQMIMI